MRISIIIPMLNEAGNIGATLASTRSASAADVIVVDGGSCDGSVALARELGAEVTTTETGRARQMNAGARIAKGDALLFLHSDTRLPEGFDYHVNLILKQPGTIAGAFRLRTDSPRRSLRLIENSANWRSRVLQMPYGDQAIFLRSEVFRTLGGYPEVPIMEDFELVRRLRRLGRIIIAPVPVITSCRRWEERGIWKTTLLNQVVLAAYMAGVDQKTIARWYQRGPFA